MDDDSKRETTPGPRAGWHPDDRDFADADLIEDWQLLCRNPGPYMLQGVIAGQPFLTELLMIDPRNGWALAGDRLLVLGTRTAEACLAVSPDDVLRRASNRTADLSFDLRVRAFELAEQARRAGFDGAGQLLEMAALAIENARGTDR